MRRSAEASAHSSTPLPDEVAAWRDQLPVPLLEEVAAGAFSSALDGLVVVSGITAGTSNGKLLRQEHDALEVAKRQFTSAVDTLNELQGQDPGSILTEAGATLERYADTVQDELGAASASRTVHPSFAAQFYRSAKGEDPELVGEVALVRAALLEWDLEPEAAQARVDAWLQRHAQSD